MPIFSSLHRISYRLRESKRGCAPLDDLDTVATAHRGGIDEENQNHLTGFTLIELLISAAIITIISSIVLVRFNAFDSTVLLKSTAYEVATAIREAQIYSLSVVNTGSDQSSSGFRYPYGLHFTHGSGATMYTLFRFDDISPDKAPAFGVNDGVTETTLRVIPLGGSAEISDICIKRTLEPLPECGRDVDISFRRPEFSALFYDSSLGADSSIEYVKLYVSSTKDTTKKWVVEVKVLGQIMVYPGS